MPRRMGGAPQGQNAHARSLSTSCLLAGGENRSGARMYSLLAKSERLIGGGRPDSRLTACLHAPDSAFAHGRQRRLQRVDTAARQRTTAASYIGRIYRLPRRVMAVARPRQPRRRTIETGIAPLRDFPACAGNLQRPAGHSSCEGF
jgi:hypothetical protein